MTNSERDCPCCTQIFRKEQQREKEGNNHTLAYMLVSAHYTYLTFAKDEIHDNIQEVAFYHRDCLGTHNAN